MIRFSFFPDDDEGNHYHTVTMTKKGNDHTLNDIIEFFKDFVLAMGYHPDNVMEILYNEEPREEETIKKEEDVEEE